MLYSSVGFGLTFRAFIEYHTVGALFNMRLCLSNIVVCWNFVCRAILWASSKTFMCQNPDVSVMDEDLAASAHRVDLAPGAGLGRHCLVRYMKWNDETHRAMKHTA